MSHSISIIQPTSSLSFGLARILPVLPHPATSLYSSSTIDFCTNAPTAVTPQLLPPGIPSRPLSKQIGGTLAQLVNFPCCRSLFRWITRTYRPLLISPSKFAADHPFLALVARPPVTAFVVICQVLPSPFPSFIHLFGNGHIPEERSSPFPSPPSSGIPLMDTGKRLPFLLPVAST